MDSNQSDITTHVAAVLQSLPPLLRTYVMEEKFIPVINQIMARYGLHVDQSAVLEQEVMLLLIGVRNPDEFSAHLEKEGAIPSDVVANIIGDINTSIFVPLQQQMRSGSSPEVNRSPMVTNPINKPQAPVSNNHPTLHENPISQTTPKPLSPPVNAPQKPVSTNIYQMPQDFISPPPNAPAFARATPPENLPTAKPSNTPVSAPAIEVKPQIPTSSASSAPLPPQALRPKASPQAQNATSMVQDYKTDPYREPLE